MREWTAAELAEIQATQEREQREARAYMEKIEGGGDVVSIQATRTRLAYWLWLYFQSADEDGEYRMPHSMAEQLANALAAHFYRTPASAAPSPDAHGLAVERWGVVLATEHGTAQWLSVRVEGRPHAWIACAEIHAATRSESRQRDASDAVARVGLALAAANGLSFRRVLTPAEEAAELARVRGLCWTPPERPLAAIDVESTGTDPERDRVIDLGMVKFYPDGSRRSMHWRVNPGVPIPAATTAVHGITDADVALLPGFNERAAEIAGELRGCDLVHFSGRKLDVPMLRAEFARVGTTSWPGDDVRQIDVNELFRVLDPRSLAGAVRRYRDREHVAAHGALPDAEATLDVLLGMLARHPELPRDLPGLDVASGGRQPGWATELGEFIFDTEGYACVNYGTANRGLRLVDADDSLLSWILGKDFPADVQALVRAEQGRRYARRRPWRRDEDERGRDDEDDGEDDDLVDPPGDDAAALTPADLTAPGDAPSTSDAPDDIPF